jgi:NADPH2:quinone reductase
VARRAITGFTPRRHCKHGAVRAVILQEFGPPEVLVAGEAPEPSAGEGEVVIDVEFANVTFVETQIRAGRPPNPAMLPPLPLFRATAWAESSARPARASTPI